MGNRWMSLGSLNITIAKLGMKVKYGDYLNKINFWETTVREIT